MTLLFMSCCRRIYSWKLGGASLCMPKFRNEASSLESLIWKWVIFPPVTQARVRNFRIYHQTAHIVSPKINVLTEKRGPFQKYEKFT